MEKLVFVPIVNFLPSKSVKNCHFHRYFLCGGRGIVRDFSSKPIGTLLEVLPSCVIREMTAQMGMPTNCHNSAPFSRRTSRKHSKTVSSEICEFFAFLAIFCFIFEFFQRTPGSPLERRGVKKIGTPGYQVPLPGRRADLHPRTHSREGARRLEPPSCGKNWGKPVFHGKIVKF